MGRTVLRKLLTSGLALAIVLCAPVAVLAQASDAQVSVQSEVIGIADDWSDNNTAKPGDTLHYLISYENTSNTTQTDVTVKDILPDKVSIIQGSTKLTNATNPNGVQYQSDDVVKNGIVVGSYAAKANGFVTFTAKVPAADQLSCGDNTFTNTAIVQPKGSDTYKATATTKVTKDCPAPTPPAAQAAYSCDKLTVTDLGNRQIEAKVDYTAKNGATFKSVNFDFGDKSPVQTGTDTDVKYTYSQTGTYSVTATITVTVNGQDQTAKSPACTQPIKVAATAATPTAPTPAPPVTGKSGALPNSGPGNVITLFVAAVATGILGYRAFLVSRSEGY